MLIVQLTEIPASDCDSKVKIELLVHLVSFKAAFLEQQVVSTLMNHAADCIKVEQK